MLTRKLGNTGLSVSEIAFGGVEIGMPYGIGVQDEKDMLSEKEAIGLLHAATEMGVNFFDTARMYGNSEALMGKAFRDRRKDVIIATKCFHFLQPDGTLPPEEVLREIIRNSLSQSLKALQTDYADVFMLHQAGGDVLTHPIVAEIFQELKKEGKIRATGVSTYTVEETKLALSKGMWDIIQLPFNLLDQQQAVLFQEAADRGTGIVIRSVLLKGLLSNRGNGLHQALQPVAAHIEGYNALLGADYPDLPTLATKFALSFEAVSAVLVGIDRMDYLRQAVATANGRYMNPETLEKAREMAFPDPAFLNLPYWDKMGWLN